MARTLAIAFAVVLAAGAARADEEAAATTSLQEARVANLDGRPKAARRAMDEALAALEHAGAVVPAAMQAGLFCERGVAWWLSGERERGMEDWRQALRVDPDLVWPTEHEALDEPWAAFEALRREVAARPRQPLGVPGDLAPGQLWVAGRPAEPTTTLPAGRYLVQVRCPEGEVRGRWWDLGRPPPWGLLCGKPLATGAGAAAAAGGEPAFDDFGRLVGVAPDPVAAPAAPVATPAPATSAAAPAVPERRGGPRGLAVASGSLAAVAGGFTAVVGVGVLAALGPGERPSTAIKERGLAPLIPGLAASGGAALGFGALAIVFAAVGGEQVEADLAGLTVRF